MNRLIASAAALEYERRLAKIEANRRAPPASWHRHGEILAVPNEYEPRLAWLVAGGVHLESAPKPVRRGVSELWRKDRVEGRP